MEYEDKRKDFPERIAWKKEYVDSPEYKAARNTPEFKAAGKDYYNSPDRQVFRKTLEFKTITQKAQRKYRDSPKYKAYQDTPDSKARMRVAGRNNKARRKGAEGTYTPQEWKDLLEQYDHKCLRCGRHESECRKRRNQKEPCLEQDHVVPVSKGGSNWITNIQPLCMDCNNGIKNDRTIDFRPEFHCETIRPF
jgi:5-methylcytosine-specific restriction endonuclease McrA